MFRKFLLIHFVNNLPTNEGYLNTKPTYTVKHMEFLFVTFSKFKNKHERIWRKDIQIIFPFTKATWLILTCLQQDPFSKRIVHNIWWLRFRWWWNTHARREKFEEEGPWFLGGRTLLHVQDSSKKIWETKKRKRMDKNRTLPAVNLETRVNTLYQKAE